MIEFSGISCSGKSTALERLFSTHTPSELVDSEQWLQQYFQQRAYCLPLAEKTENSVVKGGLLLLAHLRNIYKYKAFYWHCCRQIVDGDARGLALRSFFFKFGKFLILQSASDKNIVVDEGHIQLLFSLFVRDKDLDALAKQRLNRILDSMPVPDQLVVGPSSPQAIFIERLLSRGHHRVTGERHRLKAVDADYVANPEVQQRANDFICRSIDVQQAIVTVLKGRVPMWVLEDINEWEYVVKSFSGQPELARFE